MSRLFFDLRCALPHTITTSNNSNAIDANLLFQLYGNKEWYTCENLPEGFAPLQVANHANSVVPEVRHCLALTPFDYAEPSVVDCISVRGG